MHDEEEFLRPNNVFCYWRCKTRDSQLIFFSFINFFNGLNLSVHLNSCNRDRKTKHNLPHFILSFVKRERSSLLPLSSRKLGCKRRPSIWIKSWQRVFKKIHLIKSQIQRFTESIILIEAIFQNFLALEELLMKFRCDHDRDWCRFSSFSKGWI